MGGMTNRRTITRHGLNGSRLASDMGGLAIGIMALYVLAMAAVVVGVAAIVVLLVVLAYRLATRNRPARPAAAPVVHARVDDDAARAHRARMAAIRTQYRP